MDKLGDLGVSALINMMLRQSLDVLITFNRGEGDSSPPIKGAYSSRWDLTIACRC